VTINSFVPAFALACLVASAAQEPQVIHVDTRLVQVDVVVRNGKGPVRGLTKDDFTLFEKGKPQPISLFKVTEAHQPGEPAPALPPGMVSNRLSQRGEAPGNLTLILVDRLNTPPDVQPYADQQLIRYLQSVHKGDHIAIYGLTQQVRVIEDFTADLDRLIQAASHLDFELERPLDVKDVQLMQEQAEAEKGTLGAALGAVSHALPEMAELATTSNVTLTTRAMSAIAKHLAHVPGRKNMVWISASFPTLVGGRFRRDFSPEIQRATRDLNEANVAVYPVDARGLTSAGLFTNNLDALNTVAAATGGQAFYATNDLEGSIRKAIDDGEVTYTLGFYAPQGTLDGTFHDLRVKVARSGVDVRYRKGYLASVEAAPTGKQALDGLKQLFGNSLEATAVGLMASAAEDTAHPGTYALEVVVDMHDLHLQKMENSWVGSIAVGFSPEWANPPGFSVITLPLRLSEDQLEGDLENGFVIQQPIDTSGVTGRMRVVVQDQTTGEAGSVWVPLGVK
jgi:VWFA-related protein